MQKVQVIEPFVERVGFVDNPTGAASRLHTMSIEDYHEQRALAAASRRAAVAP